MLKTIELPLTKNYVSTWTVPSALRELTQNVIDAKEQYNSFVTVDNNTIEFKTENYTLSRDTLALGQSSKTNDANSIGQFGEGYKLALLVLARVDVPVYIINGTEVWTVRFKYSDSFETEILAIDIEFDSIDLLDTESPDLLISVGPVSDEHLAEFKQQYLAFTDNSTLIDTDYGSILINKPGKLYVNGLFVCDTKLKYGYNIKPGYLPLERDRQTVSDFNLIWTIKDIWAQVEIDTVVNEIFEDTPDVEYINHTALGSRVEIREAVANRFMQENPNKFIASTQEEANKYSSGYVGSRLLTEIVKSSRAYSPMLQLTKVKTPSEILTEFLAKNKKYMRRHAIVATKELIKQSGNWRL